MQCLHISGILGDADPVDVGIAIAALLIIVLIGAFAVRVMRKQMFAKDDSPDGGGGGFTLGDLRRLHKEGKMTDAEFERARGAAVAAAQRQMQKTDIAKTAPTAPETATKTPPAKKGGASDATDR
jgi:hypothetical protein